MDANEQTARGRPATRSGVRAARRLWRVGRTRNESGRVEASSGTARALARAAAQPRPPHHRDFARHSAGGRSPKSHGQYSGLLPRRPLISKTRVFSSTHLLAPCRPRAVVLVSEVFRSIAAGLVMAGKESSIARRPPAGAGAALGPAPEVDALERAAAGIRPSWAPEQPPSVEVHPSAFEPSVDARELGVDPLGLASEAPQPQPGLASALAPGGADATWHMPAVATRGLGPDDSTDTDLPVIGARWRVLRNMLVVTALGVGAGLAVLFVRATQPLPAPRPIAARAPTVAKPATPSQPAPAALPAAAPALPLPLSSLRQRRRSPKSPHDPRRRQRRAPQTPYDPRAPQPASRATPIWRASQSGWPSAARAQPRPSRRRRPPAHPKHAPSARKSAPARPRRTSKPVTSTTIRIERKANRPSLRRVLPARSAGLVLRTI
jgi:hypothetical protein